VNVSYYEEVHRHNWYHITLDSVLDGQGWDFSSWNCYLIHSPPHLHQDFI